MEPAKKDELKAFLRPNLVGAYCGAAAAVIGIVASFFATFPGGILLLFWLIAVIFAAKPLLQLWEMNSFWTDAGKDGSLAAVQEDYENGMKPMNGKVRIGQTYVMGKGCVVPTKLDAIEQVYEYVRKTNGAESKHQLLVRLKDGEKRILCEMVPGKRDPEGVLSVFAAIKQKQPDVKIGA